MKDTSEHANKVILPIKKLSKKWNLQRCKQFCLSALPDVFQQRLILPQFLFRMVYRLKVVLLFWSKTH